MIFNKSNEEYVMRDEVIITDWDGVLQYIDLEWCTPFKELYDEVYHEFFDYTHLEKMNIEYLNSRDEYFFSKWLAKPDHYPLSEEEYELFEYPYIHDPLFYCKCPMLNMFDALCMLSKQKFCSKIIILTQTQFGYEGDPRKQMIFDTFIKPISEKFELIQIPLDKPKWEYIKENDIYFTIFIDDRGDIIKDVAEKVSMRHKQFMLPKLGYNYKTRTDMNFIAKLEMHGSELIEYDQMLTPFIPDIRKLHSGDDEIDES